MLLKPITKKSFIAMPEITTSESQPFDHWKQEMTESPLSNLKGRIKHHPTQFPVDESEEFHDPFSELSLFLAKKIKQEIEKSGSSHEWSTRIENDLMKNILPEFKVKFPRYRLGVFALKKTFEKVSYYYEKLSCKKEAITQEGTVNVSYMIRENLRDLLFHKPQHDLYPHNEAHRIAVKISECIATLDGERPPLEALTQRIWATLKHLISGVKNGNIKSPFEQFDERDKLIVKALIEIDASTPFISFEDLRSQIEKRLQLYRDWPISAKISPITSLVHCLVAKGFCEAKNLRLPEDESLLLSGYIQKRLRLGEPTPSIVQRLSHLNNLQKAALEKEGPAFIEYLNLQIWLLEDDESEVLKDLSILQAMPYFSSLTSEDFEALSWSFVEPSETSRAKSEWLEIIELEITAHALTSRRSDFKSLCSQILSFFRRAKEICVDTPLLREKIDQWALQGEMIYHFLHFDASTPFLCAFLENQKISAEEVVKSYLNQNGYLRPYQKAMSVQATIYKKYIWYHEQTAESESSYDRFLKGHKDCENLEELIRKKFPLVPFCPHYAHEQVKTCE